MTCALKGLVEAYLEVPYQGDIKRRYEKDWPAMQKAIETWYSLYLAGPGKGLDPLSIEEKGDMADSQEVFEFHIGEMAVNFWLQAGFSRL
jgi:hypothetical protein